MGERERHEQGTFSWTDLSTPDADGARDFYGRLFGWEIEQVSDTGTPYWGIRRAGRVNAGMMQLPPDSPAPSHWLVYFGVDDLDAAAEQIGSSGGTLMI